MSKYTPDIPQQKTPPGYCKCGCGQKAEIANQSHKSSGSIKGQPNRYIHGHNGRGLTIEQRFWEKVLVVDDADSCWPWQSSQNGTGYGSILVKGKRLLAHRVAWELAHGPIPDDLECLHRCDVRICVRESHLFLGTQKDNVDDMIQKNRTNQARGEESGTAKLTESQVIEIRNLYARGGISHRKIAKLYGVGKTCIHNVVNGKWWRHVP